LIEQFKELNYNVNIYIEYIFTHKGSRTTFNNVFPFNRSKHEYPITQAQILFTQENYIEEKDNSM